MQHLNDGEVLTLFLILNSILSDDNITLTAVVERNQVHPQRTGLQHNSKVLKHFYFLLHYTSIPLHLFTFVIC